MSQARHYTKKPVTITAMQFDGTLASAQAIAEWAETDGVKNVTYVEDTRLGYEGELTVKCNTLESHGAPLTVSPNDFVIRGIQGEYYPCKPDIFEETYSDTDSGMCVHDVMGGECDECNPDLCEHGHLRGHSVTAHKEEADGVCSLCKPVLACGAAYDAVYEAVSAAGHSLPDNSSSYASPGEIVDMAIKKTRGEDYSPVPSEGEDGYDKGYVPGSQSDPASSENITAVSFNGINEVVMGKAAELTICENSDGTFVVSSRKRFLDVKVTGPSSLTIGVGVALCSTAKEER